MINAESHLYTLFHKLGSPSMLSRLLGSGVVWRLSGLSYSTAVIATTGGYQDFSQYAASFRSRMSRFISLVDRNSFVLDFGTGLGGNLIGLSPTIKSGIGLDINPFYLTQATRICRKLGITNLRFVPYNGTEIPHLGLYDLIVSIGAFERIPKHVARNLLGQLSIQMSPRGKFILHMLTAESRQSSFGRLLGTQCYTWWNEPELNRLFDEMSVVPTDFHRDDLATGRIFILARK